MNEIRIIDILNLIANKRFDKLPKIFYCLSYKYELNGELRYIREDNIYLTDLLYDYDFYNKEVEVIYDEIWKDIEGYKGMYQVSNLGCDKNYGIPTKYKLFIRQYNLFKNDYETYEREITTKDIYREIGIIYCTSLVKIERIDYMEVNGDDNK